MINAPAVDAAAVPPAADVQGPGPAVGGNHAPPPQVIDGLSIYNLSIYLG